MKSFKLTIVGDGYIGKSCLLMTYLSGVYPEDYIPTIFDTCTANIVVDGVQHQMELYDTAGQENYEMIRPLAYPDTDCFMLCYAINTVASFENITLKWIPELRLWNPKTPILLVATKSDLRAQGGDLISEKQGRALARKIRACGPVECSAKEMVNLEVVFSEAIHAALHQNESTTQCCELM